MVFRGRAMTHGLAELPVRLFAPEDRREPFLGDLIEEASTFVEPAHGARVAWWWLLGQTLRSVPALLAFSARFLSSAPARDVGPIAVPGFIVYLIWMKKIREKGKPPCEPRPG